MPDKVTISREGPQLPNRVRKVRLRVIEMNVLNTAKEHTDCIYRGQSPGHSDKKGLSQP